jgi:hypothetical protein
VSGNRSRKTNRSANSQAPSLRLRIHAEGEKTEVAYLNHWHRKYRSKTIVTIAEHTHTSPLDLVRLAASERRADRRARRSGDPYDEYWCICDVDEHKNLNDALEMARANDIKIALSDPCLELWFLLHLQEQTAHLHRHEAQRLAYELLSCDKNLSETALRSLDAGYELARDRAKHLIDRHTQNGTLLPANPSSNVFELIETIINGRPIDGSGVPRIPPPSQT